MPRPRTLLAAAAAAALTLPASASAAPGWTASQPLPTPQTNVSGLDAAMSPGGEVVIAWSGDDAPARGGFTDSTTVATKPLGAAFTAATVDGRHAVAVDTDGAGRIVRAWADGAGVWLDGQQLTASDADALVLDVSPNGHAIVAWRSAGNAIHARIRSAAGTLGPAQTLVGGGADDPEVGIADSGEAIAVWQSDTSPWSLHYKVRPPGGAFPSTALRIGTDTSTPREADLAMNARGDAQLSYVNNPGGGATRWGAAHRRAGAPFTAKPDVSGAQTTFEAGVAAIAPNGDGLVAYVGDDARVAVRTGDTYDSTPDPLATDGRRLHAAYDGSGNAFVGWVDTGATTHTLRVARRAAGADNFAAPDTIPTGASRPLRLALAADAAGNAALAWLGWDGRKLTANVAGWDGAPPVIRSVAIPSPVAGLAAPFTAEVVDVWSPVTTRWSFGDGGSAAGATVTHAFAAPGATTATVTATDARGLAAAATRGLVVAPGPAAPAAPEAPARPRGAAPRKPAGLTVRGLALTRRDVRFRLSAAARVTVRIDRCAKRCVRVRTLSVRGRAGANRASVGRRLAPGRYRVSVVRRGERRALATKRVSVRRQRRSAATGPQARSACATALAALGSQRPNSTRSSRRSSAASRRSSASGSSNSRASAASTSCSRSWACRTDGPRASSSSRRRVWARPRRARSSEVASKLMRVVDPRSRGVQTSGAGSMSSPSATCGRPAIS